ncbi:LysM peptidoglycan-binding domain-containing protein [Weissella hellenica]|nr:LysM peptidoglycan-binding domain-containing protein [Weissella hellenica]
MKTKKPSRIKYWIIILVGYVAIFLIGFFIPIAYDSMTHKDNQTDMAADAASDSSKHKQKSKLKSATSKKAAVSAKSTKSHATAALSKIEVAAGETGYAIATKYGLSVDELQSLNPDVDVNNLREGETLTIK